MRINGLKRGLLRSTSAWLGLALLCAPAGAQVPAVGPAPVGTPSNTVQACVPSGPGHGHGDGGHGDDGHGHGNDHGHGH